VKKLVDLHKGTIECISKKDQGTRITCNIPFRQGDEEKIVSDIKPPLFIPEVIKDLKILVVDDEEYNRLLFRMILERWGIDFREASGGNEALEILHDERFNLIFMDSRMPGIDGLETTHIIRQELNISADDMPVICISAASVKEDWQQYKDAGMNTFLSKPFTEEALLTTIMSVLNNTPPAISGNDETEGVNNEADGKISLENLYHLSGGDEKFINQLIESFVETTANGLKGMNQAIQEDNWADISDLAHKLLPPCRHIGATNLTALLEQIEERSKDIGNADILKKLIEDATHEYEILKELLKEHVMKIS